VAEKWVWNQYWHADRIASCFDDAGASNYDEFIASGWRRLFESLPAGARVLDLCAGNGAIALLAAESGDRLRIVAVDYADIDPRRHLTRHREELAAIDFRAGVDIEALPFPDRRFDAVVSQYGAEYSDLSRSVTEMARVVAPGGRVRLIMHAAEGSVAETSRRTMAEVDFLLVEVDLVGRALACFEAVTAAERKNGASSGDWQNAKAKLAAFEDALRQTGERVMVAADPKMLRNAGATLLDLFNRRAGFETVQLIALGENVRTELRAHRGRLEQLIAAAVTTTRAQAVADMLLQAGAATAEVTELRAETYLLGHVVEAAF